MRCPYTATKRFFENVLGVFSPNIDIEKLPRGMFCWNDVEIPVKKPAPIDDSVGVYEHVNQLLAYMSPSSDSASTASGNMPIMLAPGKGAPTTRLMLAQLHGALRGTVGELSTLLDHDALPESAKTITWEIDEKVSEYVGHTKNLYKSYKKIYPGPRNQEAPPSVYPIKFGNLQTLLEILDRELPAEGEAREEYLREKQMTADINDAVEPLINALDRELDALPSIRLRGDDRDIPNAVMTIGNRSTTVARWFYYAGKTAIAVIDTTKLPQHLADRAVHNTSGAKGIFENFNKLLRENAEFHTPAVEKVLQKGIVSMQANMAECGPWQELQENKNAKNTLDMLNITAEENYNWLILTMNQGTKKRMTENKADVAARYAKTVDFAQGQCPFLKRQQQTALS